MKEKEIQKAAEFIKKIDHPFTRKVLQAFLENGVVMDNASTESFPAEIKDKLGNKVGGVSAVLHGMSQVLQLMELRCEMQSSNGHSTWSIDFVSPSCSCVMTSIVSINYPEKTVTNFFTINYHNGPHFRIHSGNVFEFFQKFLGMLKTSVSLRHVIGDDDSIEVLKRARFEKTRIEIEVVNLAKRKVIPWSCITDFVSPETCKLYSGPINSEEFGL